MNWPLKENVWCVYFNMLSSPTHFTIKKWLHVDLPVLMFLQIL